MILIALLFLEYVIGSLIGIDIGSEFITVGIAKLGKSIEISTNFEGKRKTPSSLTFYDNERFFGEDSTNIGSKHPEDFIWLLKNLIGKTELYPDDPFNLLNISYKVVPNNRSTYNIELGSPYYNRTVFTVENLLSMIFGSIKEFSEHFGEERVKECVISVPSYFNDYQRQMIIETAETNKMTVLSLLDDNTAAAVQNCYTNVQKEEKSIIINIGSTNTQMTIFHAKKETKMKRTSCKIEILNKRHSININSLLLDSLLMEYLMNQIKKNYPNFTLNEKLNLKLFSTAKKLKHILSANTIYPIIIDAIPDQDDLVLGNITRTILEDLAKPYFADLPKIIEEMLNESKISKTDLDNIEVIGGGVRVPFIKEMLIEYFKVKDLNYHLNGDESTAMGCTLYGVHLSPNFKAPIEFEVEDILRENVMVKISEMKTEKSIY